MRVLTMGTFDIPHIGHDRFLRRCAMVAGSERDVTIGVNSDRFVKEFKGEYPLYTEDERMDFIATLGEWGCIVLNDGPGRDLIQSSMVDAVVVGSDWLARGGYLDQIGVDEGFLRSWDVNVIFVPSYAGITTSDIKRRVRDGH